METPKQSLSHFMSAENEADVVAHLPSSPHGSSYSFANNNQEEDDNTAVERFLTIADDVSVIGHFQGIPGPPTPLSDTVFKRSSSRFSVASASTIFPRNEGFEGQLKHFCDYINSYTSLQCAQILSAECFTESITVEKMVHRFLLLELERDGKKNIWIRLDRRKAKSAGTQNGGITEANDTVQLSGRRETLFPKRARRENQQEFQSPPTLLELSHLLDTIVDLLATYQPWPNNCWFFVSLLQENLAILGNGRFLDGRLPSLGLDPQTQLSINQEVASRTRNQRQRLSVTLSAAAQSPNELANESDFTEGDVGTYIRHTIGTDLQLASQCDLLIKQAGPSLSWAVSAVQFILTEPKGTQAERLSTMLICDGDTSELYACILRYKLKHLDLGAFFSRRDDLTLMVQTAPDSWSQSEVPHRVIAIHCFEVMGAMLRFNICDIETSYFPNENIEGLEERISDHISPTLVYACTNWAYHASFSASHEGLTSAALSFLNAHSLKWLEVMGLKGVDLNASLQELFMVEIIDADLKARVDDLHSFVETFNDVIYRSTPHIYLSAMTFCSGLWTMEGSSTFSSGVTVACANEISWSILTSYKLKYKISTAALSSNGDRIALRMTDSLLIRIWDTRTGSDCLNPYYNGHSEEVRRIAFCCDDQQIASISASSIRIWNAQTGETIWVYAPSDDEKLYEWMLAISPNGLHIAHYTYTTEGCPLRVRKTNSFSDDDGNCIFSDSTDFSMAESCLRFSPDGTKLLYSTNEHGDRLNIYEVSSGASHCIYEWETQEYRVESNRQLHFSPDSALIAIGNDTGICIWDIASGKPLGPIRETSGHSRGQYAMGFSDSGDHFASMTEQGLLRVWDVAKGTLVKQVSSLDSLPDKAWYENTLSISNDLRQVSVVSQDRCAMRWMLDVEEPQKVSHIVREILDQPQNECFKTDGWLRGKGGELFLWVPHNLRQNLQLIPNHDVINGYPALSLDFSTFKCGWRWMEVMSATAVFTEMVD